MIEYECLCAKGTPIIGLAVSMVLEWLGEGMDEGGVVEHNTAQYMPCTLIECKKCKSPLSN